MNLTNRSTMSQGTTHDGQVSSNDAQANPTGEAFFAPIETAV